MLHLILCHDLLLIAAPEDGPVASEYQTFLDESVESPQDHGLVLMLVSSVSILTICKNAPVQKLLFLCLYAVDHPFLNLRSQGESYFFAHIHVVEPLPKGVGDVIPVAVEANIAVNAVAPQ